MAPLGLSGYPAKVLSARVLSPRREVKALAAPSPAQKHLPRVLVVDDNREVRTLLGEFLRGICFEVHLAKDGQQALDLWDQIKPSLLITDMRMPRLDGMGLVRAVRQRSPETPIIVVTAYGTPELEPLERDDQRFWVLRKPFSFAKLMTRLELIGFNLGVQSSLATTAHWPAR